MMRYGEVITGEMRRMKIARQSRGYEPRWMWQSKAVASSAGALFVRSFERGERVYLAMASRGYDGSLPALEEHAASRLQWAAAMTVPAIAALHRNPRVGARRMTAAAIDVRDVSFAYPDGRQALSNVSLRVRPGERVAVLGPNGAGKTTLILHLNGIHVAAAGEVHVGGLRVSKENLREIRRRVAIVFQDPDDQLFMPSVREDVAFGPANLGLRAADLDRRVYEALDEVDMAHCATQAAAPSQLR